MKRFEIILLILILVGAFAVRLYGFNNPIADWHAWRQADTSAVSRNFVTQGYNLLSPRFDDLSNIPSGLDNPQGFRFVEFPIYNYLQAVTFDIFGIFTIEQWGRLVNIVFSLFSILFIYLLVRKYAGNTAGLFSAFFFGFLPFNIYYSRVILPEPGMIMTSLAGIYFFDKWLTKISKIKNQKSKIFEIWNNYLFLLLAALFTSAALLLKPYALFFMVPMLCLVWNNFGWKFVFKKELWLFLIISLVPLIAWRYWMTQFPEGIPVSDWLFNGGNIRFKGAYFHWIFAERIGKLILGYWGLIVLGAGIIELFRKKYLNRNLFLSSFLVSSLIYLIVIARGNVQHDYYQALIMPSISIILGLGSSFLLKLPRDNFYRGSGAVLLALSIIFAMSFSWYHIRDFYNINNPAIIKAGEAVDKIVPKNARIIAILHGSEGDTTFLYQTKRQGWTSFQNALPEMIEKGAEYLVFANPTESDMEYKNQYKLIKEDADYIIFDLKNR